MAPELSRRSLLTVAGGLGAGYLLAGCGSDDEPSATGASGGGGELVVRTWSGVWEGAVNAMAAGFESATGVSLLNDPGSDTLTLLEQRPGEHDVAWLIGTDSTRGMTDGTLEPIDTGRIERFAQINPRLSDGITHEGELSGVPISYTATGIIYNRDRLGFEITTWEDLWREELRGQLCIQNAPSIGGLFLVFTGARVFGSGPDDYEAGWAAIEELAPNVQFLFNTSSDGVSKLASGSVLACVTIADQGVPLRDQGIETVIPEEGTTYSIQSLTVPAASENKDAAYEFINFMLDPDNQIEWARNGKAAPSTTDVELPDDLASELLETPAVAESLWPIDWYEFGQQIPDWTTRWQRIFGS